MGGLIAQSAFFVDGRDQKSWKLVRNLQSFVDFALNQISRQAVFLLDESSIVVKVGEFPNSAKITIEKV